MFEIIYVFAYLYTMKNCFFLLLTFLFFNGCGKKTTQTFVDDSLQPFVDKFVLAAKIRGVNIEVKDIVIKLGDANDYNPQINKVGYCIFDRSDSSFDLFQNQDVSNKIIVDQKFWNRTDITDIQRTELLFHELGHCILGRKHDTRLFHHMPESLMYPHLVSMSYFLMYRANESYFFDELFKVRDSAIQGNPNIDENGPVVAFLTNVTDYFTKQNDDLVEKGIFMFSEEYGCTEEHENPFQAP